MDIVEIIGLFISENEGYKYNLNNFITYIKEYKRLPLEDTVLGGITTKDIIQSLQFNIDREQFKSVSIAQKYSVAVAKFFIYTIVKGYIKNKDLFEEISAPKIDEKSYYSRINTYISKNKKLNDKEPIMIFSSEAIKDLVTDCDSFIERIDLHKTKKGFEKLVASLGIKVLIFAGIKYGIARKISLGDINMYTNILTINGFNIRLPLKLSIQFQYYLKLREELHVTTSECSLFSDFYGNGWGEKTSSSKMPNILAQWSGRTDTTGLTKFGISNLIKAGVNDSVITKLTGAEETLLKSCISIDENSEVEKWDKYLNSRISGIDFYYLL